MKNFTFITLVSLSLTVAATAAVQNDNRNADDLVVTLPTYGVTAARENAVEKSITQSLASFRREALARPAVRTELESLGTVARQAAPEAPRSIAVSPLRLHPARS